MMRGKLSFILLISSLLSFGSANSSLAQGEYQGFIYGKVTTITNQTYVGRIRWGSEEVYWSDHFNSSKTDSRNFNFKSYKEKSEDKKSKDWLDFNWEFLSIWDDKYSAGRSSHIFACQFGDLKTIRVIDSDDVIIELKNGAEMKLRGYSNDIGARIKVLDVEIGEIALKWSRIKRVEFSEAPSDLDDSFGKPLEGVLETTNEETLSGIIQWDHDERISTDKLDGDSRQGKLAVPFGKIKSLQKMGKGTNMVLHSGKEFYLTGSNDVNAENKGIIVTIDGVGRVDVPWSKFRKVTFSKNGKSGKGYNEYKVPKGIKGTVKVIDGTPLDGLIIFDLDEAWEFEILDGQNNGMEYKIPFRNIKKIIPKNYNYSTVILKNGHRLILGDSQDVSERNDGLLIFEDNNNEPEYVKWKNIDEIILDP
ncbi:hypothetical protein QQ008_04615 [Fulvivirgaceae bacterium BMA10]|uniref:Uncharacterized protein n=1 Tax=Splendidivirga corallicola TaxID=3051826 RepID=A0ABT8KIU1_9BACT|nr:hypothetical protein [Fulvivirgaceae bacterium BMA10]